MPGIPSWLPALHQPHAYPHPTGKVELIETHLSWVFLTGEWAYKLKKPVSFGFVDFSSLEKREAACREELRLNRRTAPGIYDAVVTLVDTESGVRFGDTGSVLDYAVRMRQFPQSDVLLTIANSGRLTAALIEQLATSIAAMHATAVAATPESAFGSIVSIRRYTEGCLPPIEAVAGGAQAAQIGRLRSWVVDEAVRLEPHFDKRRSAGFVRECHGDLHLGNIVLVDGIPQPFDCLEFNPELRFIDVVSDLAFLVMDLIDHDSRHFAWRLLNGWLDATGDFSGLPALRYYEVYRALVRAKVAAIRLAQPGLTRDDVARTRSQLGEYLALADRLSGREHGGLVLMHGLSGSGKSFVGRQLASDVGAVCLRSDRERQRPGMGRGGSPAPSYSEDAIATVYDRLLTIAGPLLQQGYIVLVDATFLKEVQRRRFQDLADQLGIPWLIVSCDAPIDVLAMRIEGRQREGGDVSDATVEVLHAQFARREPLTAAEQSHAIKVDTSAVTDGKTLAEMVGRRLDQVQKGESGTRR